MARVPTPGANELGIAAEWLAAYDSDAPEYETMISVARWLEHKAEQLDERAAAAQRPTGSR